MMSIKRSSRNGGRVRSAPDDLDRPRSMTMMLFVRLAWRNIWRHRRRTVIVVLAMGLGLALMMMYDGMIDGFQQAIYGNAVKVLGGNLRVHAAGYSAKADSQPLLPIPND